MFSCGQYVRHTKTDLGTGQVIHVNVVQQLQPDGTIASSVTFGVRWLDQQGAPVSIESAGNLARSMRDVPKFNTAEEAEAWMEAALEGGSWTRGADDLNAVVADVLDQAASQVALDAERALAVRCGGTGCGCGDCVSYTDPSGFQHVAAPGCVCENEKCGCIGP